jgi:AcrR family transcriptional regulator
MVKTDTTEIKIVDAASKIFVLKGFDGARMQEIADEAGINKALLHYYFRTKDNLFEKVFEKIFGEVFSVIRKTVNSADDFEDFLEAFVFNYIDTLLSKPYLPQFVLHELNRNPQRMVELFQQGGFDREKLYKMIQTASEKKLISPQNPVHLVTNILALCVFPFIARPILQGAFFGGNQAAYQEFLLDRPGEVLQFINRAIIQDTESPR